MLDEILCLEVKNGKKVISITKVLSRVTYMGLGSGVAMATHFLVKGK